MITHVEIKNFRCLREVSVSLRPLTVLIGPNNSGKSAFLSSLYLPRLVAAESRYVESDSWLRDSTTKPMVQFSVEDSELVDLTPAQSRGGFIWKVNRKALQLLPISYFGKDSLKPSMSSEGLNEEVGVPSIDDEASKLPAYLDMLLRVERRRFLRIIDKLHELLPGFVDIHIATPKSNQRRIDIEWSNGYRMPGEEASYGVKLLIFFVALSLHPSPPKLVLIDEPENGIHPQLLREVIGLLRGLTTAKFAQHPTQVVLSTHSPYLMDFIDLETDQVLVTGICDDGSRSIKEVDRSRLSNFLDEFMLGEVWINQGEAGLLPK